MVRSSSPVEDAATTSMAGYFRSILDVRGWESFVAAVRDVQASGGILSAGRPAAGDDDPSPMAVLVQPFLRPECAGVLFGIDPVTGAKDRRVVEAVAGGPEKLVSGKVAAQHYVFTPRGRPLAVDHQPMSRWRRREVPTRLLDRRALRRLARLAETAASAFGSPQDIEWALDSDDGLWLLQSRPVTSTGSAGLASGPLLGPGPVAETFPEPLRPLEADMWVTPMADGIREALSSSRVAPRARLAGSPVVTLVHGRAAADLDLFGYGRHRQPAWRLLDPLAATRRLRAAWHVGWLRTSLAQRAGELIGDVDARLASVPPLAALDDRELLGLLHEAVPMLRLLHREEVLAGTLLRGEPVTAAAVALTVLEGSRRSGLRDGDVVRRDPVVLTLVSPRVGKPHPLPPTGSGRVLDGMAPDAGIGPREGLRLRARWVQELTARAAVALARRLAERDLLAETDDVALLRLRELEKLVAGPPTTPPDLTERRAVAVAEASGAPLPVQFRLAPNGEVVPVARPPGSGGFGVGAGGGRGSGPVRHGSPSNPPLPGEVLLVRTLDPRLAPFLPGLAGVVAEAGSTLSHLAIVARECGVPIVVAVPDALQRFPEGTCVLVDGTTGEVSPLSDAASTQEEVTR